MTRGKVWQAAVRRLLGLYVGIVLSTVVAVCGSDNEELGTALTQLKSANWEVRYHATKAIAEMGPAAEKAVPALREALRDTESMVREGAVEALATIGPAALPATPDLIRCLDFKDLPLNKAATDALVSIGPAVIPFLLEAPVVAYEAAGAKLGFDSENAWDAMAEMNGLVLQPLRRLGPLAVPVLVSRLGDPKPKAREVAAILLCGIGEDARTGIAALTKLLSDPDASVRLAVIQGLGRLGPMAREAAPELRRMMPTQDEHTRREIQNTLKLIETPTPSPEKH